MNRLLKYINILIAICLVAVLAAVWWYVFRPHPRVSGSVSSGVSATVSVARDSLGIPVITAANEEDAWFAQGYVTAQDRLWQMDMLRRTANGELSEIVGPLGLESDRETRVMRMRRIAEHAAVELPEAERFVLAAYTRGVNAFIDSHLDRLPLEFKLLRYDPRPWRIADSLSVGLLMFRNLTSQWRMELVKSAMLRSGDPAKIQMLFPVRTGMEPQLGSNAWALASARTQSGRAMLANDMHLDVNMPAPWYIVRLRTGGLDVAGVSLPGIPGVIAGHNGRIAWGMTNLHFDVQDLYAERFDPATGRYIFRGQVIQARAEQETIRVRNANPVNLVVWSTAHGPIIHSEAGQHFALRWIAGEPGGFAFPFIAVNKARNWSEFRSALEHFPGPAQNFVYADAEGNIGYQVAGKLPARSAHMGDVPAEGASGEYEWNGFIPFDQLPAAFNPAEGVIASANQNPFPERYPHPVSGTFAPHYRVNQIRALLASRGSWRPEDMLAVQTDVYSAFSHFLAHSLVSAFDARKPSDERFATPIQLLREWNGQMDQDLAAPLIVTLAFNHFRRAVAENAVPGTGVSYDTVMSEAVVEHLLRARPAGWFADWDDALLQSFGDGLDEGARRFGREPTRWRYGNYMSAALRHPLGARVPWYISYPIKFGWLLRPWRPYANFTFDIGPFPQSGSASTVKQTTQRVVPSMRMVVDFGDLDSSLLNIPTGQSGQIASPHYKDQFQAHYSGRSFRMEFSRVEAGDTLYLQPAAPSR